MVTPFNAATVATPIGVKLFMAVTSANGMVIMA